MVEGVKELVLARIHTHGYHINQSASDSYTSTHFIAMREPQIRFQAFFVGKEKYFVTKIIFFVDSLAHYVHFHKENGFPFTRKLWVGTGFLGDS